MKMLADVEANELRLLANDIIDKLWRSKKRCQLQILQIQLTRAFLDMDSRQTCLTAKIQKPHRTKSELKWLEKGIKR